MLGCRLITGRTIDDADRSHLAVFHVFRTPASAEAAFDGCLAAEADCQNRERREVARYLAGPPPGDDELPRLPGASLYRCQRLGGSAACDPSHRSCRAPRY